MGDTEKASRKRRFAFLVGGALLGALLGLLFKAVVFCSAIGMGLGVLAGSKFTEEGS